MQQVTDLRKQLENERMTSEEKLKQLEEELKRLN